MDDWAIVQRFNRLILRGKVPPLTCDRCGRQVYSARGPGDVPVYRCWPCNITVHPGAGLLRSMRDVVEMEQQISDES